MFVIVSAVTAPDGTPALDVIDGLSEAELLAHADKTWPAPASEALTAWIASPTPGFSIGFATEEGAPMYAIVMWFR